jgi:predicted amidohydrolase YtcJ
MPLAARPADLVLRNARIHTVDPALPEAEAMAVADGVSSGSAPTTTRRHGRARTPG